MNLDHNAFKILIIDDEQHIRQSFADFLEDCEYEVVLAENGRIGLELLESEKPDLVLLDLRMPEMDGLEVLQQGRKLSPDLPMIVISGANRIGDVVRALRYGAWDYLEKPVQDFTILGHSVEKALEKANLLMENRAYQEQLETMVKKRTLELEKANDHLSNINARLHKIVESTQGLTGCVDMKQFGMKLLDEFAETMAASGGSLYLAEEKGLKLVHSLDPEHAATFLDFPLAENSIFNTVLNQGQSLLVQNIETENQFLSSGWTDYSNGSLLAFPIVDSNSSNIGVITLHSKEDPPFVEQDKEIGAILAAYSCETIRAIKAFDEARKSERQLRQSRKMEAIGTLAGGIAHDFNNILSGIIGYAQLVEMDLEKPNSIKKNIAQIMKGAGRAGELVSQILTFSRQGEGESEMKPLKLYLIVKEAVKFLRSSIPSTINILEKIQSKNSVLADATQVHQVIINLCTNAYHAMQETGGTLSVSLCDIRISEEGLDNNCSPGQYIKMEIEDTGNGIEKKYVDRIFDPYFTTKEVSQGTGLGLAVVNGIVKKHNGFIQVASKIGRGTVFKVFFPVVEKQKGHARQIEAKTNSLKGTETIMFVDDEQDILNSMQEMLSRMGYRVFGFSDACLALEAFENNPDDFDMVITDMTMPKMDGSRLSKEIFSLRKEIPVILCTGFHETYFEKTALQTGIRRYVQKPITARDLSLIIREELDKKGN